MQSFKKYVAEFIGTFVLVFFACGTAAVVGCSAENGTGYLLTALAFGLVIVAMAYSIGNVSGCHINPAITLGVAMAGKMTVKEAAMYMIFQVIGAFIGSSILYGMVNILGAEGTTTGANSCTEGASAAMLIEIILTFVFVLVVLCTTDEKKGAGNFAGLAIGLSLILIHLVGIHYTGTSVNPARSIAPAVFAGGIALQQLWAFIVGPFIGAAIASVVYKYIVK